VLGIECRHTDVKSTPVAEYEAALQGIGRSKLLGTMAA